MISSRKIIFLKNSIWSNLSLNCSFSSSNVSSHDILNFSVFMLNLSFLSRSHLFLDSWRKLIKRKKKVKPKDTRKQSSRNMKCGATLVTRHSLDWYYSDFTVLQKEESCQSLQKISFISPSTFGYKLFG